MYHNFMLQLTLICIALISTVLSGDFKVYWNIPTFMCRRYKIPFVNATKQFGIIQNRKDDFHGNRIALLYDPGNFPAILQDSKKGSATYRNHGIPQEGDLRQHLNKFENDLETLIPNRNFSGVAVIDFESWRPIYRQNFGVLKVYKDLSTFTERQRHPYWDDYRIEAEASKRFEKSARAFILDTLLLAKELRPKAKWGYYGLPFCFNGRGENIHTCADYVKVENDGMQWLVDNSDIVLPSVYLNEKIKPAHRIPMIQGRIKEAFRMAKRAQNKGKPKPKVLVYHRYRFADTLRYLTEAEQLDALTAIKQSDANGVILWGSSTEFKTRQQCEEFYEYLTNTLGPVIETLQPAYTVKSNAVDRTD